MPKLSLPQIKALLSLNIGRDVGKSANVLTNAEIEAAIKARFPGSKITAHDVIPAQPNSKFGPFESTSRVSIEGTPGSLNDRLFGLSQDLKQQAIPGVNHTTGESVLAGPQAADWGGEFSKQHFVQPGDQTAFGNRQEDFKKQFTPDFYHASPSNKIKEFDPTHAPSENGVSLYAGDDKANATFITRDPRFANSMLPAGNAMGYKPGSTVYPVSANLGKHFDYETPEGLSTIKNYLAKKLPVPEGAHVTENDIRQWVRDRSSDHNELKEGSWAAIEHPEFQRHLQDEGYDSFAMQEAGRKNIGIYEPHNIRGKFAEYNPDEAMNPDFMKAQGGPVEHFQVGGKVVRSGLTELLQLMKNQGGAGVAQRLERAADLVPNLEHQYQPQALKEAFSGNRSLVSVMNPADFEKYAAPISSETKSSLSKSRRIGEPGPGQDYTHMPLGTYDDYIKYLQQFSEPGGGGFRSMPYLQLGQRKGFSFPNIQGHEGRHRTDALTRQGNQSTLVGIEPRPELRELPRNTQEEYLNALSKEVGGKSPFVMPQESEVKRGLIELPEMFAAGGEVLKKVLKFAEDVPFIHYSNHPSLNRLEPSMYGRGIKGQEAARLKDAPDIKDRSYFYVNKGEQTSPQSRDLVAKSIKVPHQMYTMRPKTQRDFMPLPKAVHLIHT